MPRSRRPEHCVSNQMEPALYLAPMNGTQRQPLDLFVVGGGINGAGIACDAAGRTLKVGLCEMNDFASGTSSKATKLIHGGLRYLEHYEFRLVREALMEREVLLAKAPHISWPLRFVLPHEPHLRPRWMLRLGLFLYDHLDWHMTLPKSQAVDLTTSKFGRGLKPSFKKGFVYSDAWVDDARMVISNLKSARDMGAAIYARHRCTSARARRRQFWNIELAAPDGGTVKLSARGLVNACGPWVKHFLDEQTHVKTPKRVRLIKGSHIVVPRLHDGDHAFILQNRDNRIVFVIPYEREFSLIGTTDIPVEASEDAGLHAGGDRLSLRARQPLHGQAGHAGRRGVDLFRRAPAVRRRRRQSLGGHARLSSRGRCAARSRATALGVRRQDHDLSPAGRARAGGSRANSIPGWAMPGPPESRWPTARWPTPRPSKRPSTASSPAPQRQSPACPGTSSACWRAAMARASTIFSKM